MTSGKRPNVVLVVLDTVRAGNLELYGHDRETMPNLTTFAEEATTFPRAYTNAPWTLPAHASLFTGQLPSDHQCHGDMLSFDPSTPVLAQRLSENGYETHAISNNIWISDHFGFDCGFDTFSKQWQLFRESKDLGHVLKQDDKSPRELAAEILSGNMAINLLNGLYGRWLYRRSDFGARRSTDDALDMIDEATDPFFLFVNYMEAHAPFTTHSEETDCLSKDITNAEIERCIEYSNRSLDYHTGRLDVSPREFDVLEQLYDSELRYLDTQLGRLFDGLRDEEILSDSLVVIVGDHGENLGDYDLMAHRFSVNDTLLHVPLVISYPDYVEEPNTPTVPVDLRDVAAEIAGIGSDRRAASMMPERERETPVVAEYLSTDYTPEAKDEKFAFAGSRFDRRYVAGITKEHKYAIDDEEGETLYKYGDTIGDKTQINVDRSVTDDITPHLSTPTKSGGGETVENEAVRQHLTDLGYL